MLWNSTLRDGPLPAIAGADIRRREIHLHPILRRQPGERSRILTHELFHFVWVRLGNPRRASWKQLLEQELAHNAKGDLGWSSEWRKGDLPRRFPSYACEAFCDTAAWLFSTCTEHPEFTLASKWRAKRRAWFLANPPFRY